MADILIIEDQPAVREVLSEVIESLGMQLRIGKASSLKEARQLVQAQRWDAIITDLRLGDGQSLDLIAELREQGNVIPIILVSAFLSPSRVTLAKKLKVSHILAKPFDPEELLLAIREAMPLPVSEGQDEVAVPSAKPKSHSRLLPEMFEMDRKLGLLYRMFDEIPKQHDVTGICDSALQLGMEMVHAQRGYLALFERKRDRLVMVARKGMGTVLIESSCDLIQTPFRSLIYGEEEYIESLPDKSVQAQCWPGIQGHHYVATPVYLEGVRMGVLCLMDMATPDPLKNEEKHMLALLIKKLDTLLDNRAVHAALADSMRETLIALVRSLEARDRYTKDHSSRVGGLSMRLSQALGVDDETQQLIHTGGLLHDIGKVGIADEVLLKPGRYTDKEYAIMKAHPAIGDAILKNMDTLVRERLMVRHHHERWDGKGYPDGIGGEEIPFEARIVCVADAIDAMTTHRVYRMARPISFCLEQVKLGSGTQFDPQVVEAAVQVIEQGEVHTQAKEGDFASGGLMPLSSELDLKTGEVKYV